MYIYPSGSGAAYCGGSSSGDKIATSSSGPSSLNIKKNLNNIAPEYKNIYEDLRHLNMYNYDYKYNNINNNLQKDYGFIIDEIEDKEYLKKYFRNYAVNRWIDNNNNLIRQQDDEDMSAYTPIEIKEWERDSYIKGLFILIKALQYKIDELEHQIKKEETN